MTLELSIWLAVVAVASVAMLLGIFALSNRIKAIDECLFDLRQLEIALRREINVAVVNQASELTTIKLHLYQLKRQQNDMLGRSRRPSAAVAAAATRIRQIAIESLHSD